MDRNVRALILALLCVLAVSLAAATLANPQHPAGTGDGSSGSGFDESGPADRNGDETGDGNGVPEPKDGEGMIQIGPACWPFLLSPEFALLAAAFYVGVGAYFYRRDGWIPAVAVLFLVTMVVLPGWLVFTGCGTEATTNQNGGVIPPLSASDPGSSDAGGSSGTETLFDPPMVLAALAVVVVLLALVAFRATGDDPPPDEAMPEEPAGETDEEALGALGNVAGEAADRIAEAADVENEVYRAWREMTGHLDVENPESSTPAEFAAAAESVGMDDAHVAELTDLFREVRYGGAAATDDREQRAIDALRAIESTYGGED
ncbi:hypothetical protein HALDL1_05225 [Halobacterium sp. DL1]|nr:hypothetical protein HALDL1_05225 [Halobacterium sp. DL1]